MTNSTNDLRLPDGEILMIKAPLPVGMIDTPELRERLNELLKTQLDTCIDQELVDRVKFIMDAPAKDRWKIANLTNHDWQRIHYALSVLVR